MLQSKVLFSVIHNGTMADDEAVWTQTCEKFFDLVDLDASGFVELKEAVKVTKALGGHVKGDLSKDEIAYLEEFTKKEIIEAGDTNDDGKLSKEEWVTWLKGTIEEGHSIADEITYIEGQMKQFVRVAGMQMRVSNKKGVGFYIRAATSFLQGVPAQEATEGKEAVEAKDPVAKLKISGLGDAINVAVATAAAVVKENLGTIHHIRTRYPDMPSGRGCAQITITIVNNNKK